MAGLILYKWRDNNFSKYERDHYSFEVLYYCFARRPGCHYCPDLNHTETGFRSIRDYFFTSPSRRWLGWVWCLPKNTWRQIEVEEMSSTQLGKFRLEALDATKLSLMRPDGHLGPRTHPFPLAKRVQNDCVHGCLPGPIETCLEWDITGGEYESRREEWVIISGSIYVLGGWFWSTWARWLINSLEKWLKFVGTNPEDRAH
jgi:hypothetical protein